MSKKIYLLLIVFLVMGCTPSHKIVFESDPPSAVLFCDGERLGLMPNDIDYDVTEEQIKKGFFMLHECEAKWVSGAKHKIGNLRVELDGSDFSRSTYMFRRPDYPNYNEDVAFAQEQEFMKQRLDALETERSINSDYYYDDHYHSGGGDIARMH